MNNSPINFLMVLKIKASIGIFRIVTSIASEFISRQLNIIFRPGNYEVNIYRLRFVHHQI
jgi:hypothetical protein